MAEPSTNIVTLYRGSSPLLGYTPAAANDPADPYAGWTTEWTLRTKAEAATAVLNIAGVWNSASGRFEVTLSRTQTLALKAGTYVASLFRTDTGSEDVLALDTVTVAHNIRDSKSATS